MDTISSLTTLVLVVVVAVNLVLTFVVLRSNVKSATNRIFSLLAAVVSIWSIVMYFSLRITTPSVSLLLIRSTFLLATPMSMLFLLFSYTLPSEKLDVKRRNLALLLVATVFVMAVVVSPFAFTGVSFVNNFPNPVPGPGVGFFGLYIFGATAYALYTLIRRIRESSGNLKRQLVLVMVGFLLMYGFMILTVFLPVAILGVSFFVPFFPLYTLLFTGFTSYAIVRHELFDVKIFATAAVTFFLWVVLFSKLFVSQTTSEFTLDLIIFIASVIFGYLLTKSVKIEILQRVKLQELTKKLRELDEQKDEFISMAAHELRAPMTAIKGYLSMILDGDTGEISSKARGYLTDADAINDRLVRLVNNMLNVSRIEEGRMVYQLEVESLSNVSRTAYATFRPEVERKGLKFELDIPKDLKDKVEVDPDRIHEVLANILSNAVKFTDKGSISLKLSQPNPQTVRAEVKDTGPGISKEEKDKLFNKFYRAETTVGKTTGTGLGLYICKLLVERFKGKLGVESEFGKGSTFWFELPLAQIKDNNKK